MSLPARVFRNRYVAVLGSLALATAAWNVYVALHAGGLIAGSVTTVDASPVTDATVTLYERTLTTLEPRATAITDGQGRFRFQGMRLHHFVLEARKEGLGAAPRADYRLYFRGQNVTLPPLALPRPPA